MKLRRNGLDWDELLPKMEKLFTAGKTYSDVAKELNISFDSAKKGAKKLHLDYRPDRNFWTDDEINELRLLLKSNKSYHELEEIFSGRHTIQSIASLIRYRGDSLNLKYSGNVRHFITENEISKAIDLSKRGLTCEEIGRELNCNPKAVKRELSLRGEKTLSKSDRAKLGFVRGKGFIGLTEEILRNLVEKERLPFNVIAERYEIDSSTVAKRAHLLGIEEPEKILDKTISYSETYVRRISFLEKFLGHEPSKEEKKLRLSDIIPQGLVEEIYEKNNFSNAATALELGISVSSFNKLKKEFKLRRPHSPQIKDYSDEFYRKLYVEDGLSYGDIAEIVGLSADTIRKYLCKVFPEAKKTGRYSSMGEKMVGDVLEELGISFTYNKRLLNQNLENPEKVYVIDFVFEYEGKHFWIEYNGKQHYEYVKYFYKTHARYESQLERDRFIEKLATELNINLLVIPYTEDTSSRIKEIIVDYLNTII